jgi:hypothetical protein
VRGFGAMRTRLAESNPLPPDPYANCEKPPPVHRGNASATAQRDGTTKPTVRTAGSSRDDAQARGPARPRPALSTLTWWADVTLGADLGVAEAGTDDIYAAMDWLVSRQDSIEAELARRHKASCQHDPAGQPYRSFGGLLEHLATLARNQVRFPGARTEVPILAEATADQRYAFELIGAPIPLALT